MLKRLSTQDRQQSNRISRKCHFNAPESFRLMSVVLLWFLGPFPLFEWIVTHCEFPHFHLTSDSYCSSIRFAITAPSNSFHSQLFCLDVPLNLRNKLVRYNYAHKFHFNGEKTELLWQRSTRVHLLAFLAHFLLLTFYPLRSNKPLSFLLFLSLTVYLVPRVKLSVLISSRNICYNKLLCLFINNAILSSLLLL